MDRPVLYVNACVRKESRTGRLAEKALALLGQPYEEVRLEDLSFPAVDEDFLRRGTGSWPKGRFGTRCLTWPGSSLGRRSS